MSGLAPEALLRLVTSFRQGDVVLGFGSGSLSMMRSLAAGASSIMLIERPGVVPEADVIGIEFRQIDDWSELPFSPKSVGLVLLPPPDEWPQGITACRMWLAAIRQILSDSGEILLVAPNRFGHKRLRRMLKGTANDVALSLRGYKRLLAGAGFNAVECFGLYRDRSRLIGGISPIGLVQPAWSLPPANTFKGQVKRRFHLANEFAFRAAPGTLERSSVSAICDQVSGKIVSSGAPLRVNRLFASAKGKAFVVFNSDEQSWLVRIPLTPASVVATQHHIAMLQTIRERVGPVTWLPSVIASGQVTGCSYQVETVVSGRALRHELGSGGPVGYLTELEVVLKDINRDGTSREPVILDGDRYEQRVTMPLDRVLAWCNGSVDSVRVVAFFEHHLRGMSFLPGVAHGDLSISNIFVAEGRISGIIDWDDAQDNGIPVLDAINHLVSRGILLQRRRLAEVLQRLAFTVWPVAGEREFLERMYRFCQVDPVRHPGLVYLNWLYIADARLAEDAVCKPSLVKQFVDEVLMKLDASGQLP